MTGDHAITEDALLVEPEIAAAMGHEGIEFDEALGVEQEVQALTGGEFALGMLLLDACLSAAQARLFTEVHESVDLALILGQR